MRTGGELWAITSYFNPRRSRRRLANYRLFRKKLQIPLLAVELSFGRPFELQTADAEILVQLRDGDVMWQKERLLNVALKSLPAECRKVVWLDCDILIESEDWPGQVRRRLDDFPVLQPYHRLTHLERDRVEGVADFPASVAVWDHSVAYAIQTGQPVSQCVRLKNAQHLQVGMAWAARREILDHHGFYDFCIMGGADRIMACAAFGCFAEALKAQIMNERQQESYLAWAVPFFRSVESRVAFVEASIYHLWHGEMTDRRYLERYWGLRQAQFDPGRDIACAEFSAWRWHSDKPALHQYVMDYFAARNEDG